MIYVLFILVIGGLFIFSQGVKNIILKRNEKTNRHIMIGSLCVFLSSMVIMLTI